MASEPHIIAFARMADRWLRRIVKTANEDKPPDDRRNGGFLCVRAGTDLSQPPLLLMEVGWPDPRKRERYFKLAQEKALRLAGLPKHVSSWQSRDPDIDRWGGGVRVDEEYILAFSGLPELYDEALVLLVAHEITLLSGDRASAIIGISGNQEVQRLTASYSRSYHP